MPAGGGLVLANIKVGCGMQRHKHVTQTSSSHTHRHTHTHTHTQCMYSIWNSLARMAHGSIRLDHNDF
jgi:hypothetical protein